MIASLQKLSQLFLRPLISIPPFFFSYYHQINLHYVTSYLKAFLTSNPIKFKLFSLTPVSSMHPHPTTLTLLFCPSVVLYLLCLSVPASSQCFIIQISASSSSLRTLPSLNSCKTCLLWNLIRYCLTATPLI